MHAELRDTGDLKAVARALGRYADGKALKKELSAGLRNVLKPFVPRVRAAYLGRPGFAGKRSRGRARQPSLRSLMAKATRVEVRLSGKLAGARVRVDGRKMPSGMRSLQSMYEGPPRGKRWRHPVYGDRTTWVAQPSTPTFYAVVQPSEAQAVAEVERVVGAIFDKIERAR
jgi:hypothetical protein